MIEESLGGVRKVFQDLESVLSNELPSVNRSARMGDVYHIYNIDTVNVHNIKEPRISIHIGATNSSGSPIHLPPIPGLGDIGSIIGAGAMLGMESTEPPAVPMEGVAPIIEVKEVPKEMEEMEEEELPELPFVEPPDSPTRLSPATTSQSKPSYKPPQIAPIVTHTTQPPTTRQPTTRAPPTRPTSTRSTTSTYNTTTYNKTTYNKSSSYKTN